VSLFRSEGVAPYFLLICLCALLYIPGLARLPVVDRDEARYAQATRQMIETGDYVRIRFQNEPRNKKPIGIYWLQAASVSLFGDSESKDIRPFRIPSAFCATLAVLLTFGLGRSLFDTRRALLGASLLAACLMLIFEAHQAKTDAALLASTLAAQASLALLYSRAKSGEPPAVWPAITFWTALGIGILIKEPIAPVLAALTIISLVIADRNVRWLRSLRPLPGIVLLALIVCPWAIAIYKATSGSFFYDSVVRDILPKLLSVHESHGFVPGYYLLLSSVTFWPGSAFLGLTIYAAWQKRWSPGVRFCLAWIVPYWILFELAPTKLPHYTLPVYPALALLTADALFAIQDGGTKWPRFWPRWVAILLWSVTGAALFGISIFFPWYLDGHFLPESLLPGAAALIATGFAVRGLAGDRPVRSVFIMVLGATVIFGLALHRILPEVRGFWLSRTVADAVHELERSRGSRIPVAAVGYQEPSLVFMLGTDTGLLTAPDAVSLLARDPQALVIVDNKSEEEFHRELTSANAQARPIGSVRGFHYTKGRWITLKFYVSAAGSTAAGAALPEPDPPSPPAPAAAPASAP
jgi:4-amino-4-deoxy-L-arabinose transferase-like glycosyltransferase